MSRKTSRRIWLAMESCWKTEAAVAVCAPVHGRARGKYKILKITTARAGCAEGLLDAARRCIAAAGLRVHDIDGIAIDVGPGPFTGLRIGVCAARALAQTLKVPVVPVTGFAAAAVSICGGDSSCRSSRAVAMRLPSTKGKAFIGRMRIGPGGACRIISAKCEIIGDGSPAQDVPDVSGKIGAEPVLRAALSAAAKNWDRVLPLYLRPSYAQEALIRRRQAGGL